MEVNVNLEMFVKYYQKIFGLYLFRKTILRLSLTKHDVHVVFVYSRFKD